MQPLNDPKLAVERLKTPGAPFVPAPGVALDLEKVTISTERLILRPVTPDFAERIFVEYTPEISRYLMTQPSGRIEDTLGFIEKAAAGRAAQSDLALVILKGDTEEFLGMCGLHSQARSFEPHLGIWIKKSAHGNGYGLEAITALCGWVAHTLDYSELRYDVDRSNHASQRIAKALGGKVVSEERTPRTSGPPLDTLIFHIPLKLRN